MLLPFLSPFIPFLLHQIWPSESRIQLLPQDYPALFLAGEEDELVKPVHMKELYRLCSSERKEWKGFRRGTHSEFLARRELGSKREWKLTPPLPRAR